MVNTHTHVIQFVAIIAHKFPESFGVAISFIKNKTKPARAWALATIFASISPIGVAIGIAISSSGQSDLNTITAVLISITTGMFLYVSMTEVIPEEFAKPQGKWWKFLFLVGGCAFMTYVSVLTAHEH